MTTGIFIYGTVVFGLVSLALGLIAWGIVNEQRDRSVFEQGSDVYGKAGAESEASRRREAGSP